MNKLLSFVKEFTNANIPELNKVKKIGRKYFYMQPEMEETIKKIGLEPYSAGLFLGELIDGRFRPEFPLMDFLVKHNPKRVICNRKGETLFLYANNLIEESMLERNAEEGMVLVLNQDKEVLGYGELKTDKYNKKIVHNILNRSNFLKREEVRKQKKSKK
jgi:ribosome biogenesis protein Nip4